MPKTTHNRDRRRWLGKLLASGALGAAGYAGLVQGVLAMAREPYREGLIRVQGVVTINGRAAQAGALVRSRDTIVTGPGGSAVFVAGRDAFLMRANSRVQIGTAADRVDQAKALAIKSLSLISGKLLSVFARGGKRELRAPTVVIGVRGTAVYIEVEPERTYVCTCYGEVDLDTAAGARETVKAYHHDAPRYIYGAKAAKSIVKAPVINHTDDELYMLESLVGRTPPFTGDYDRNY